MKLFAIAATASKLSTYAQNVITKTYVYAYARMHVRRNSSNSKKLIDLRRHVLKYNSLLQMYFFTQPLDIAMYIIR